MQLGHVAVSQLGAILRDMGLLDSQSRPAAANPVSPAYAALQRVNPDELDGAEAIAYAQAYAMCVLAERICAVLGNGAVSSADPDPQILAGIQQLVIGDQ